MADGPLHCDALVLDPVQLAAQTATVVLAETAGGAVEIEIHEVTEPHRADGHESFSMVLKGPEARRTSWA